MNIFRQWRERRRAKMEKELADAKENIHIIYQEIINLKKLANSIHDKAVDLGSEHEYVRNKERLKDLRHNEVVLQSLNEKRDRLRKKLGHE